MQPDQWIVVLHSERRKDKFEMLLWSDCMGNISESKTEALTVGFCWALCYWDSTADVFIGAGREVYRNNIPLSGKLKVFSLGHKQGPLLIFFEEFSVPDFPVWSFSIPSHPQLILV